MTTQDAPRSKSGIAGLDEVLHGGLIPARLYRKNADRRKDEFLATLAHELRNPLAPIRTGLQALARPGGEGAAAAVIRSIMERQLSQMVRLIDDLLDVSRISSGKVVLQRNRVDLRAIAELAIEASQPFITAGHHNFKADFAQEPVWVDGDASRLSQVISNLLNNAAKYTAEGGQLSLRLWRADTHAFVCVKDNGVGIPPNMLQEVFDMFTQVNRTLDRAQGGLGIGLSLVRRLTELHGGEVSARSEGLGRGSAFTVKLPLVVAPQSSPASAGPLDSPSQHPRLRILAIDDIADVADVLKMLLDLEGFDSGGIQRQIGTGDRQAVLARCYLLRHRPSRNGWPRNRQETSNRSTDRARDPCRLDWVGDGR